MRSTFVLPALGVVAGLLSACAPMDNTVEAMSEAPNRPFDVFADAVVSFKAGASAGFGQDRLPEVVLGPPHGGGTTQGSLDVLSLGKEGEIILEFTDLEIQDGPGVDFLVFENSFPGWVETAHVSVSDDGRDWKSFESLAGPAPVHSSPDNGVSPTDVAQAGGDGFDLAEVKLSHARLIRIQDSGKNPYGGTSGGFDLDAVAIVNSVERRAQHGK